MKARRITAAVLWLLAAAALAAVWAAGGGALWLGAAIAVLLLPGVSLLLALAARRGVRLSLTLTPTVPKHAAAQAVLLVKNDALLSARALFRVRAVNALTREETVTLLRCTVPPKGTEELRFLVESRRCGQITAAVEKAGLLDICGIFAVPLKNGKHRRAHDRPAGHVRARDQSCARLLHAGGERQLRARLPRERSHGDLPAARIRPGDDLRRIHWKMTAKTDRLIVREASLPLQRSLLVFWDKTAADKLAPDAADALAESVSSVCQSLSEAGFAYTLGWSGEGQNVLEEVPDTDRLLALLPRMVRSRRSGGERNSSARPAGRREFYGRVLLFAHAVPPEIESAGRAVRADAPSLLTCGDGLAVPDRSVHAGDYAQRLHDLEFME